MKTLGYPRVNPRAFPRARVRPPRRLWKPSGTLGVYKTRGAEGFRAVGPVCCLSSWFSGAEFGGLEFTLSMAYDSLFESTSEKARIMDSGSVEYECSLCEAKFTSHGSLAIHEILEHAPDDAESSGKHRHIGLVRGDGPYDFVGRTMP